MHLPLTLQLVCFYHVCVSTTYLLAVYMLHDVTSLTNVVFTPCQPRVGSGAVRIGPTPFSDRRS